MISVNTKPGTKVVAVDDGKISDLPKLEIGRVYTVLRMEWCDLAPRHDQVGVALVETESAHAQVKILSFFLAGCFFYDRRSFRNLELPKSITSLLNVERPKAPVEIVVGALEHELFQLMVQDAVYLERLRRR